MDLADLWVLEIEQSKEDLMRKLIALLMVLVAGGFAFAGGGSEEVPPRGEYQDGFYFAQEDGWEEDSNWKAVVYFEVEDGSITTAHWTAAHRQGGTDKYTRSENGNYGMMERSDAQAPWYEQADATVEWLLDRQNPAEMVLDNEGGTDAISGVSITVSEFFELVEQAIEEGPTGRGPYDDGAYSASAEEPSEQGWEASVNATVIGGYITAVYWDETNQDGESKRQQSIDGEYGMVENSDATASWVEQARDTEQWVIDNQEIDPTISDGRVDAISGVSITVSGFFGLLQEALSGAM